MVSPGNFSLYFAQSKFPESTTAPPRELAKPFIYFVVECVTISAPHSKGLQKIGVGKVLSTINGTPCLCAALANLLGSLVFEGCGLHNGNHSGFSLFRLIASLHTDGINVVICHSYYSFHLFRLLYSSMSFLVKGKGK